MSDKYMVFWVKEERCPLGIAGTIYNCQPAEMNSDFHVIEIQALKDLQADLDNMAIKSMQLIQDKEIAEDKLKDRDTLIRELRKALEKIENKDGYLEIRKNALISSGIVEWSQNAAGYMFLKGWNSRSSIAKEVLTSDIMKQWKDSNE